MFQSLPNFKNKLLQLQSLRNCVSIKWRRVFVHLKLTKNTHELNIKATLNRICGSLSSLLELSLPVHNLYVPFCTKSLQIPYTFTFIVFSPHNPVPLIHFFANISWEIDKN
ncbi:hypothetical protein HAX54_049951 [Datura stramonium]|uniref:Uncharacterized protein n=1 Tax=Datura stramonium TaxID=4076 RepID=A0ABS8WN85_DATST|nr:hypothetical protein [Datura stramonium]